MTREADSLELAPTGSTGTGATVIVEPDAVERSLAALQLAAARHGGAEVTVTVDGPQVIFEPITEDAAPIVLGEEQRDLGAAVAVMLLRALGGEAAVDGERLTVVLPTAVAATAGGP